MTLFGVIQLTYAYATASGNQHQTASIVPFYWMVLIIGGIIMITLSYVSWRKYIADKKRQQKRNANN